MLRFPLSKFPLWHDGSSDGISPQACGPQRHRQWEQHKWFHTGVIPRTESTVTEVWTGEKGIDWNTFGWCKCCPSEWCDQVTDTKAHETHSFPWHQIHKIKSCVWRLDHRKHFWTQSSVTIQRQWTTQGTLECMWENSEIGIECPQVRCPARHSASSIFDVKKNGLDEQWFPRRRSKQRLVKGNRNDGGKRQI